MDHSRRNFIKKATAAGADILPAPAVFSHGALVEDTRVIQAYRECDSFIVG
jgi:hypothetical protein